MVICVAMKQEFWNFDVPAGKFQFIFIKHVIIPKSPRADSCLFWEIQLLNTHSQYFLLANWSSSYESFVRTQNSELKISEFKWEDFLLAVNIRPLTFIIQMQVWDWTELCVAEDVYHGIEYQYLGIGSNFTEHRHLCFL